MSTQKGTLHMKGVRNALSSYRYELPTGHPAVGLRDGKAGVAVLQRPPETGHVFYVLRIGDRQPAV